MKDTEESKKSEIESQNKGSKVENSTSKKRHSEKAKKGTSLGTKIILRIVSILTVCLVLCAISYFGYLKFADFFSVKTNNQIALIDRQLSLCQELVTAKYRYSDIITMKKTSGFAKSYAIVKYSGLVRVGIEDITDVSYSVSLDGKTITLSVPAVEMLGNEIVSQSIFDEKRSLFVPISTQEVFDEIEKAKNQAAEDMIAEGVLEEAQDYAIRIITQFMYSLGFENVKIK
ncbi:MAG: DUF4230 domain-containing protein [Treponema sp.]|jgi:hypothetical protein|nr:DUF4230 domain-containing protein [Treponema sp.]